MVLCDVFRGHSGSDARGNRVPLDEVTMTSSCRPLVTTMFCHVVGSGPSCYAGSIRVSMDDAGVLRTGSHGQQTADGGGKGCGNSKRIETVDSGNHFQDLSCQEVYGSCTSQSNW